MPRTKSSALHQTMRIQLLGAFRITVGSHVIGDAEWRRRKASALVKILALEPRHRLHREQIIELLWTDLAAGQAANNFHQTLYVARRILDPSRTHTTRWLHLDEDFLTLSPNDPLWVDVEGFETAAAAARRSHDPPVFREALDLYAGELLPEDRYEEWAVSRRESLHQEHISLLVALAEIYQAKRDDENAIETLRRVLAHEPVHEGAHRRLMELYALTGRREQALTQYQLLCETLRKELDAEPNPDSRQLYQQILTGQLPQLAAQPATRLHNLSVPLTSFIGRAREMSEVRSLLDTTRLLTLTGAGGCGKTRLAVEAARDLLQDHAHGVWLVELASLTDPEFVPRAIASALGLQEQAGQALTQTLIAYLKPRQLLLVLDNCEHLIYACAEQTEALLRACPNLRILATSREPLRISGELTWLVPSLSLPDPQHLPPVQELGQYEAVRLFVERARAVHTNFSMTTENAASIAQLCYRLDGIPLALELAAARMTLLSVEQILARLDDRFRLLTGGSRTALSRQQTLRATVDWSYELLSPRERVLFRRLAVFAGGFSFESAAQVTGEVRSALTYTTPSEREPEEIKVGELLDALANLVDKSLVVVQRRGGETRYRLLETIRQYARECLAEAGEQLSLSRRHLDWCLAFVEQANPNFWGAEHVSWVNRLETEHDNLRAALAWCLEHDITSGLRLATLLSQFWVLRGYVTEGQSWLRNLLAQTSQPSVPRAKALLSEFVMSLRSGNYRLEGEKMIERILNVDSLLDDHVGRIQAHQMVGAFMSITEGYERTRPYFELSLSVAREIGFTPGVACAIHFLGVQAAQVGDYVRAQALLEESVTRFGELGAEPAVTPIFLNIVQMPFAYGTYHQWRIVDEETLVVIRHIGSASAIGFALANLGNLARAVGEHARAQTLLEKSLAQFRWIGDQGGLSQALAQLGNFFAATGEHERARGALDESLLIRRTLGDRRGVGRTLNNLANAATLRGEYERARALLDESLELFEEMKDKPGLAQTFNHLGNLGMEQGDYAFAASMYEWSMDLFQQISKRGAAPILLNLAECARLRGDDSLSRSHSESALVLFQELGDRRGVAAARASLGDLEVKRAND
jgi:predicted ATPase/DNA-binding SARP family transcriptional activator